MHTFTNDKENQLKNKIVKNLTKQISNISGKTVSVFGCIKFHTYTEILSYYIVTQLLNHDLSLLHHNSVVFISD